MVTVSDHCTRETTNEVARVIEEELDGEDCTGLCMVARDVGHGGPVTYEEWVHPLKMTGGQVCLRADQDERDDHFWFTVDGDTIISRSHTGFEDSGVPAMGCMKRCISIQGISLTPVLREDTPFADGEVDDGNG